MGANSATVTFRSHAYQRVGGRWVEDRFSASFREKQAPGLLARLAGDGMLVETIVHRWSVERRPFTKLVLPKHHPVLHSATRLPAAYLSEILPGGWPASLPLAGVDRSVFDAWSRKQSHLVHEPFGTYWKRFFPSVADEESEKLDYPALFSLGFWELYGEPLVEFARVIQLLDVTLRMIAESYSSRTLAANISRGTAALRLDWLLGPVAPAVELGPDDSSHLSWRFPSLLSCLSMMIARDLDEGRIVRVCETCQTPFLSSAYQARYCSARCRWRLQKRRAV